MKFTIYIFLGFFALSCTGYKIDPGTIVKNTGGLQSVENKKENIFINYYGDYLFHQLNRKTALNWDKNFTRSIGLNKKNKILLFTAHTIIEPYCSTMGLLYKNSPFTETIDNIVDVLTSKLMATNLVKTTEIIGTQIYTTLSYQRYDPLLKVASKYLEYYYMKGENLFRIVFWTTETDEGWLERESKGIVKTIHDQPIE